MKADIRWLDDPEVFRVNQLPAHSDHKHYESRAAWEAGESCFWQKLSGEWSFCYSVNAKSRPEKFFEPEFDRSGFDMITVPGHIELAGYDKIHYVNNMYPWEGHIYRRPAYSEENHTQFEGSFSEAEYNPVGSYLKEFDLEKGLCTGRVMICFEGVEEAMYVWLNGHFVGYAEDSFTPSEFDLSPFIKEKGNVLAVEVHKRSTAAYLEDQDFFRFFGIFRDVFLYAKPAVHVEDIKVEPVLKEDYKTGMFGLQMKLSAEAETFPESERAVMTLRDAFGDICMEKHMALTERICLDPVEIGSVICWGNENPYLYTLTISIRDGDHQEIEFIPLLVGFRKIEIKNKVIHLNGKRLVLNGVNRHEWNAKSGRCITAEDMRFDIDVFRRSNINAVRTCHYPNQMAWYALCDEYGIYVMSETNLESHGSWQKLGLTEPTWNVPGDIPQWRAAALDRAKTHYETFKNHPSILFWSLGNESYAGDNIAAMNQYFKQTDETRLVHYEGVFHNRNYEDCISDVESRMYAKPGEIEEYLQNGPKKPFLLCEYMHDMGNSLGGLHSYMKLLDQYEMYQGGFVWDYIDQALEVWDEATGQTVLRYGGDFDDRPSDYEFSGNGILFADRTEKPALQEVRYYYGLYK